MNQYVVGSKQPHEDTSDELNQLDNRLLGNGQRENGRPFSLKSELLNVPTQQVPAAAYVAPPQVFTPVPPAPKVPSFDERKMEIVRQYRQSPNSRFNQ